MALLGKMVGKIWLIHSSSIKRPSELDSWNLLGEAAEHFLSCSPFYHMHFKFLVLNEAKT